MAVLAVMQVATGRDVSLEVPGGAIIVGDPWGRQGQMQHSE